MSEESKIELKHLPLESFAVGDSLRIFQTNLDHLEISGQILYGEKPLDDNIQLRNNLFINKDDEEKIKFKYLMNEHDKYFFNNSMSDDFKSFLLSSMMSDLNEATKKSLNYYDTDKFEFNRSDNKIFQIGSKCYILNKNSYKDEINAIKYKKDSPYILTEYFKDKNLSGLENNDIYNDFMIDKISSYITSAYASGYFENTQNVDNKSIPIYDLNENAISKLYMIKLFDQQHILNVLKEHELLPISSKILFNSETFNYDTVNYDSIVLLNIFDYLKNERFLKDDEIEKRLNRIFDSIFSYIPKESFYRLLIPIGQINILSENENSLNEEQQYLYSIDLLENNKNWTSINYFSLKNLKNPELDYDYSLEKNENFKSVNASYFNFDNNLKNKIIDLYNTEVYDKIKNYINDNDLRYISSLYILNNNLDEDLRKAFSNQYKNVSDEKLSEIFEEKLFDFENDIWAYNQGFKLYMLEKYNLNIEVNTYIITNEAIDSLISDCFYNFKYKLTSISKLIKDDEFNKNLDIIIELIQYGDFLSGNVLVGKNEYKSIFDHLYEAEKRSDNTFLSNADVEKILDILNFNHVVKNEISKDIKLSFDNPLSLNNVNKFLKHIGSLSGNEELISKITNYSSMFVDLYKHENCMEMNGFLNGIRKYNNCGSNLNDDIWLSYYYDIKFDENFIKNNNISYNEIQIVENDLSLDDYKDLPLIKINESRYIIPTNNTIMIKKFENYAKMLKTIQNIPFGEYIKGQHYYKKEKYSKSNIFSLDVKNSGFNYTLYSIKDVKKLLEEDLGKTYDLTSIDDEVGILGLINDINTSNFGKINFNVIFEEDNKMEKVELYDNLNNLKFFKSKYKLKEADWNNIDSKEYKNRLEEYDLLIVKNKMQKHFNNAIRKSIQRYIPANSVLWKIQYSGN